jgi:hypothetical protein
LTGTFLYHGSAEEWLLLVATAGVWVIVWALFRRAARGYKWVSGNSDASNLNRYEELYRQEKYRLAMASVFLSAGLISVIQSPPPGNLAIGARWKLYVILVAAVLLGRQSWLAGRAGGRP